MEYGFYALVSRMKNINRWALMRNSFTENVQEHSHMTAVLAHALAVLSRDVFGQDADPDAAAAAALFHDASEIFTGDMPTPVKYYSDEIREAYKSVEDVAVRRLLSSLPESMRASYADLLTPRDERTLRFVKAADKLSAYIKCVEELKAGNEEFRSAADQSLEKLRAMAMPEVGYFLEHFMPAFEMTLDEITF
ncbi:MAG: 5'-deoxynucleotidase [Oscillospiraceae bacterium]|nr:5'-deoxynucleotidase [Oscillospiraceae bacterium]